MVFVVLSIFLILDMPIGAQQNPNGESSSDTIRELFEYLNQEPRKTTYNQLHREVKEYQTIPDTDTFRKYEQLNKILKQLNSDNKRKHNTRLENIKPQIEKVKKSLFLDVPREINFVWVGELRHAQLEYLNVWEDVYHPSNVQPKYKISVWTDSGAYLAYFLSKKLQERVEKYILESEDVPFVKTKEIQNIISLQDQVYEYIIKSIGGLDTFDFVAKQAMIKFDIATSEEIDAALKRCKDSWDHMKGRPGIQVREIKSLWSFSDDMKKFYLQELGLRQNLAAASDIVRARILKKFGGIYSDVDLLPPLNYEALRDFLEEHVESLAVKEFSGTETQESKVKFFNELSRIITEVLVDSALPGYKPSELLLSKLAGGHADIDWRALMNLVHQEKFSRKWFKPFPEIKVPPGAEAAFRGSGGRMNNNFMAASKGQSGDNPAMRRLERDIKRHYERIEAEHVRLPHGVWPGWPVRTEDFNKAEVYRLDGLVQGSKATVGITGPRAVRNAILSFTRQRPTPGEGGNLEGSFDTPWEVLFYLDHALGPDYYNEFTAEDRASSWLAPNKGKQIFQGTGPSFKLVLRVGETPAAQFASKAIYAKSVCKEPSIHLKWDPETRVFAPATASSFAMESRETFNIAIIGHGDGNRGIQGMDPSVLASKIAGLVPNGKKLGKVSFTVCQMESPEAYGPLKPGFLRTFLDNLPERLNPKDAKFIVRNSEVQTNIFGRKLYAIPETDCLNRLLGIKYKWVRATPELDELITKVEVKWNSDANDWHTHTRSISHGEFVALDMAVDRSGPLHASILSIASPVSTSVSIPDGEEYSDFSWNEAFKEVPHEGTIVSEPGISAVLNALRSSDQEVLVVGSSPARLEGTRKIILQLAETEDMSEALNDIKTKHPSLGAVIERGLKEAQSSGVPLYHSKLVKRVRSKKIKFVPMDMTATSSSNYLENVIGAKNKVAAFFLSHSINADNLSPSTLEYPQLLQRRALMNVLADTMKSVGGTLRQWRSKLSPKVVTAALLESYRSFMKRLTSGEYLFKTLKAQKIVKSLGSSIKQLQVKQVIPENTVAVLESLKMYPLSSEKRSLQLISVENPDLVTNVRTNDETLLKVRAQLDEELHMSHRESRRWSNSPFAISEAEPVNTLNAGMFVLALSHLVQGLKASQSNYSTTLSKTIEVQMWMNFAGGAIGFAADTERIVKLAQTGLRETAISSIESSARVVTDSFKSLSSLDRVVSPLFAVANVFTDFVELALSDSNAEDMVIATQTGFDIANLALVGVAMKAGETTIGFFFGGLVVPFTGIGIGVRALVESYSHVAEGAAGVGQYFGLLDTGFIKAYRFENDKYIPNAVTVIKKIDFKQGHVEVASPLMAKSIHYSGSGKENFFAWPGGFPRANCDPAYVFDIRSRLGRPEDVQNEEFASQNRTPSLIILPFAPMSTIYYTYQLLPGALSRQDYGFDLLRKLEERSDFDFDFYLFLTGEWIVNHIRHTYRKTEVRIIMDENARDLVTPKATEETEWMIDYHIVGSSGTTRIVVQDGVHVTLDEDPSAGSVSWILDGSMLHSGAPSISVLKNFKEIWLGSKICIGYGKLVASKSRVIIHTANYNYLLNLETGNYAVQSTTTETFKSESLHENLRKLLKEHHTGGRFIRVKDVTAAGTGEPIPSRFYDVQRDEVMYTQPNAGKPIPDDTMILAAQGNDSWFISMKLGRLWRTSIPTHEIMLEVQLFDPVRALTVSIPSVHLMQDVLVIEATFDKDSAVGKCRFIIGEDEAFLSNMEIHTKVENEHWRFNHTKFPDTLELFSKVLTTKSFPSLGDNPVVFVKAPPWVEYTTIVLDVATKKPLMFDRYWIQHETGLFVRPLYEDENEIKTAVFAPHMNAKLISNENLLIYFGSSRRLWQYVPTNNQTGELSELQRDVTNVFHHGNVQLTVDSSGVIFQRMKNRKSQIIGFTIEALNPIDWSARIIQAISSRRYVPFYQIEKGQMKPAGIWYFPRYKSYAVAKFAVNDSSYRLIDAFEHGSKALLLSSNGTLWTVPLIHNREINFTSNSTLFNSDYGYTQPEAWKVWDSSEIIANIRLLSRKTGLETVSGLTIEIKEKYSKYSFHLAGIHLSTTSTDPADQRNDLLEKFRRATTLNIELPAEDYVPVWSSQAKGWVFNFKQEIEGLHYVDATQSSLGEPLGVQEDGKIMFGLETSGRELENSVPFPTNTFSMATRVGNLLSLICSGKTEEAEVPCLNGVKEIAVKLNGETEELTIQDGPGTVALDTIDLGNSTSIELKLQWDLRNNIRVKVENELMLKTSDNKAVYWKGHGLQTLNIRDEGRRSTELPWKPPA